VLSSSGQEGGERREGSNDHPFAFWAGASSTATAILLLLSCALVVFTKGPTPRATKSSSTRPPPQAPQSTPRRCGSGAKRSQGGKTHSSLPLSYPLPAAGRRPAKPTTTNPCRAPWMPGPPRQGPEAALTQRVGHAWCARCRAAVTPLLPPGIVLSSS
jgi:hypothetical protein